jgi:hypothetical protein
MPKVSDIYNNGLDERFTKFSGAWEALLGEWDKLADEVPDGKHAYEMKYAGEIKKAEGTEAVKKATALLACRDEYLTLLKSEARLEFIKAKVKWVDKEMSILQTIAANARAEMSMAALPNPR